MHYELFTRVSLRKDIPEKQLRKGDVATIVEHHPSQAEEAGYSLEVFNALGETITVVVVPASAIEPLHTNEVLHVRQLESSRI
ncbi:MAG TPA: DUF4926 domain-containing protein [Bacteroidetes bacterium]|nr:DUF4926 domain-containing protein [Bacteroidota bacterium]